MKVQEKRVASAEHALTVLLHLKLMERWIRSLMRKKAIIGILMGLSVATLAGCEEPTYIYDGKEYKESVLEDVLSDTLEVENPELDIDLDIMTETEE